MKSEIHTPQTAPEASPSTLAEVRMAYKFIPNLMGSLAESPLAVSAYLQLSGRIKSQATLTPTEQRVTMLAASFENGCDYCMAARSAGTAMAHIPSTTIQALRDGSTVRMGKGGSLGHIPGRGIHPRPRARSHRHHSNQDHKQRHHSSGEDAVGQRVCEPDVDIARGIS